MRIQEFKRVLGPFAAVSLLVGGCLPPGENADTRAHDADTCDFLSAEDLAIVRALEAEILAQPASAFPDGEFHAGALHNRLAELGRIGCKESSEALLEIAGRIDRSASFDGAFIEFEHNGARNLQAVFESLASITPDSAEARELARKYAAETRPIRDGVDGFSVRRAAEVAALALESADPRLDLIRTPAAAWDPDYGNCSSSYLLVDGSRTGFIADWDDYLDSVAGLEPATDRQVLSQILNEPHYCDGRDGYSAHEIALGVLAVEGQDNFDELMSALGSHGTRGSRILGPVLARLSRETAALDADRLEELRTLVVGEQRHADERARAAAVELIAGACRSADVPSVKAWCAGTGRGLLTARLGDLYKIVRTAGD